MFYFSSFVSFGIIEWNECMFFSQKHRYFTFLLKLESLIHNCPFAMLPGAGGSWCISFSVPIRVSAFSCLNSNPRQWTNGHEESPMQFIEMFGNVASDYDYTYIWKYFPSLNSLFISQGSIIQSESFRWMCGHWALSKWSLFCRPAVQFEHILWLQYGHT